MKNSNAGGKEEQKTPNKGRSLDRRKHTRPDQDQSLQTVELTDVSRSIQPIFEMYMKGTC